MKDKRKCLHSHTRKIPIIFADNTVYFLLTTFKLLKSESIFYADNRRDKTDYCSCSRYFDNLLPTKSVYVKYLYCLHLKSHSTANVCIKCAHFSIHKLFLHYSITMMAFVVAIPGQYSWENVPYLVSHIFH